MGPNESVRFVRDNGDWARPKYGLLIGVFVAGGTDAVGDNVIINDMNATANKQ
jgi:hypothetical protein